MLIVQFLTENEKITKLKAIVKFKDQMPISPLLLQRVSQNKFNWTIIDFSSSDDGSLQNSAVEFANEKSLQQINAEVKELAGKARNKKLKPEEPLPPKTGHDIEGEGCMM